MDSNHFEGQKEQFFINQMVGRLLRRSPSARRKLAGCSSVNCAEDCSGLHIPLLNAVTLFVSSASLSTSTASRVSGLRWSAPNVMGPLTRLFQSQWWRTFSSKALLTLSNLPTKRLKKFLSIELANFSPIINLIFYSNSSTTPQVFHPLSRN